MGLSTYVYGIKAPDQKWREMKAAHDACSAAGVSPPKEVREFFGFEDPDDAGVVIKLEDHPCARSLGEVDGYEIDLSKLPADVTHIRFENSW